MPYSGSSLIKRLSKRLIKLVTEASEKVCGEERRDGYIRTTLASRKKMPVYENKAEYKL